MKTATRACIIVYLSYYSVQCYFFGDDITWNAFKDYGLEQTNISLKSLYLSSMTNISLFMAKPLFRDIKKVIKRCLCMSYPCDRDSNSGYAGQGNNSIENDDCQRCFILHKKLYVKWKNENVSNMDKKQMANDVSS